MQEVVSEDYPSPSYAQLREELRKKTMSEQVAEYGMEEENGSNEDSANVEIASEQGQVVVLGADGQG